MPTFLLSQFCTCPIASISGTCIWMHFCEWLCYKASEAQETIKYWLFYSHIWLWCVCWGMASKPSVIRNVWMWFALTLVCEGITSIYFHSDMQLTIGPERACTRMCDLCICNRGRGAWTKHGNFDVVNILNYRVWRERRRWEGQIVTKEVKGTKTVSSFVLT